MPRLGLLLIAIVVSHTQANASTSFDQLDWVTRDKLPAEHQAKLPSFCSGDYLPPSLSISTSKEIRLQSDNAEYQEISGANLIGSVELQQSGQQVESNSAHYNQQSGQAQFKGDVVYRNGDVNMSADFLNYNAQTGLAKLQNAQYVIAPLHMRGDAQSLNVDEDKNLHLLDSSYTFCEPGHNDWDIKASEIHLYHTKRYGEAYHARLRIKEVPILYLPYFRFPLGEGRLSGFLNPQISLSAQNVSSGRDLTLEQTELNVEHFATPYYFNIAPNYDDTLTPRYLDGHGILTENEFRYLNIFGEGTFRFGYIGDDKAHNSTFAELSDAEIAALSDSEQDIYNENLDDQRDKERWSKSFQHVGNITKYWQDRINYEEVSDLDYDDDFSSLGLINRSSYLKQNAELEYDDGNWNFLTLIEKTQTIDEAVADKDKPYHRLPQLTLTRESGFEPNQFDYQFTSQVSVFERDSTDLTGGEQLNGERFHSELTLNYPLENSWGFIKPNLQLMSTQYNFQNIDDDATNNGFTNEVSRDIYISSIDAGMYFERSISLFKNDFVQTLEPRIMAAYIPYEDQSQIPLFDTTETSFSYSQLFKANRFTGYDRVGDTKQLSYGLTTRFLNDIGSEVFTASMGQIHYFEDRRVLKSPGNSTEQAENDLINESSYAGELQWLFYPGWRFKADMEYNPNKGSNSEETTLEETKEKIEKASAQLNYQGENGWLMDMNYTFVEAASTDKAGQKQVGLAFFAPINDRWAFYAQKKHDIWDYTDAQLIDKKEGDNNFASIEGLAGIEYQNCCWRVQATYEEHTRSDKSKDYQYLIQVHFKGLGILGTDTDSMLGERILGYDEREIHDY
jgi:LPS-assembly protein